MILVGNNLPPAPGVYVAYTNSDMAPTVTERVFLTWDGQQWFYPMSDQRYRDHVYQWIGPLPVLHLTVEKG